MDEYIKREAAIAYIREQSEECQKAFEELGGESGIYVDAVIVTRCEDCVRWDDDPDTYGADGVPKGNCMKSFETMCADDFCSYGKRKDGGDG